MNLYILVPAACGMCEAMLYSIGHVAMGGSCLAPRKHAMRIYVCFDLYAVWSCMECLISYYIQWVEIDYTNNGVFLL